MAVGSKWKAVKHGNSWQVQTEDGSPVASVSAGKNAAGIAKLIAASPYLLEALKAVVDLIGDEELPDSGELSGAAISDMARAAVSIAESG